MALASQIWISNQFCFIFTSQPPYRENRQSVGPRRSEQSCSTLAPAPWPVCLPRTSGEMEW